MGLPLLVSSESGRVRYAQPLPCVYVMVLRFWSLKSNVAPAVLCAARELDSCEVSAFTALMSMNGAVAVSKSCATVRGNCTSVPDVFVLA